MNVVAQQPSDEVREGKEVTIGELLRLQMEKIGRSNRELASDLNYKNENVIAMMRSGKMRLPFDKVGSAARSLQLDPVYLMMRWSAESGADIMGVLNSIFTRKVLSRNEERLIEKLRPINQGIDVDLDAHPEALNEILAIYTKVVERERAVTNATLERLARDKNKKKS